MSKSRFGTLVKCIANNIMHPQDDIKRKENAITSHRNPASCIASFSIHGHNPVVDKLGIKFLSKNN